MCKKNLKKTVAPVWILSFLLLSGVTMWAQTTPEYRVPDKILAIDGDGVGLQNALGNLYPIGWSRDGKFAFARRSFVMYVGEQYTIVIQDLITDRIVWYWEGEAGVALKDLWRENHDLFSEHLARFQIDPDEQGSFSSGDRFPYGGREYFFEVMPQFEEREFSDEGTSVTESFIWASEVFASSPQLGRKAIYVSPAVSGSRDVDAGVQGTITSPFEDRAAVIYATVFLDIELFKHTKFMLIGSHLTFGFQKNDD